MVTFGLTVSDIGLVAPSILAKSDAVADVVEDCHWIVPTEPVANVSVVAVPLQIDPAPLMVLTTDTGLIVIVIGSEIDVEQTPLETTTL